MPKPGSDDRTAIVMALIETLEMNRWWLRDLGPSPKSQEAQGVVLDCVMEGTGLKQVSDGVRLKWYNDFHTLQSEVDERVQSTAGLNLSDIMNLNLATSSWSEILGPGAPRIGGEDWTPRNGRWNQDLTPYELYEFVKGGSPIAKRLLKTIDENADQAILLSETAVPEGFKAGNIVVLRVSRFGYEFVPPDAISSIDPWSIDPDSGYRMLLTGELPPAIRATLERLAERPAGQRMGGPLQLDDRHAESEARAYLQKQVDSGRRFEKKAVAMAEVTERFGISDRAFKRIWKRVAPADWSQGGRKKKQ